MPYDKKLHFGAGVLISCLFGYLVTPAFGLQLSIVAGIIKEIRDWHVYRGPDWKDMVCTWAGGLVGWILLEVII